MGGITDFSTSGSSMYSIPAAINRLYWTDTDQTLSLFDIDLCIYIN